MLDLAASLQSNPSFHWEQAPSILFSGKNKIKGLMCHTSDKICAGHKCFISRAALVTQRHRVPRPWPLPSTCHKSRGGAEKTNNALRQGVFFTPPISSRIYEASKAQLETCFQKWKNLNRKKTVRSTTQMSSQKPSRPQCLFGDLQTVKRWQYSKTAHCKIYPKGFSSNPAPAQILGSEENIKLH